MARCLDSGRAPREGTTSDYHKTRRRPTHTDREHEVAPCSRPRLHSPGVGNLGTRDRKFSNPVSSLNPIDMDQSGNIVVKSFFFNKELKLII